MSKVAPFRMKNPTQPRGGVEKKRKSAHVAAFDFVASNFIHQILVRVAEHDRLPTIPRSHKFVAESQFAWETAATDLCNVDDILRTGNDADVLQALRTLLCKFSQCIFVSKDMREKIQDILQRANEASE